MKIKEIVIKAMRISLIPSIEWKAIKEEQETPKELMWNFAFPIILFSAVGRDFGVFFATKAVLGYSLNLVLFLLFNLISWVVIPYLLIILSVYLLNFTLPKIGIETDHLRLLKLIVYTFTPLFIVTFFVYFHPLLKILIPIGIFIFIAYTLFVFYYGIHELFEMPLDKKFRFIVITIPVGFFIIFLTQHIYSNLLDWIFPGMAAYVR